MKLTPKTYAAAYVAAAQNTTARELSKVAARFWNLVWRRHHWAWRNKIIEQVGALWREQHGVELVTVTTAKPLTTEAKSKLQRALTKQLDKKVEIESVVKPHLLGGMIITIGDRRVDASLKGRLDSLYHALAGSSVNE